MRNPCKECDYYHKENNTCQSKKCCTGGDGTVTIIDRLFCKPYKREMKGADDETEIQNSNLTFEKVMEEIQTQVIEFPDTHQKFIFVRKIETDGDSIKICGWEYKGVKDED